MFSRTLRSSKTKSYKYLVASCFQQEVSPVEDATYDMDGGKIPQIGNGISSPSGNLFKSLFFVQNVKNTIRQVFERHGATDVQVFYTKYFLLVFRFIKSALLTQQVPLLMPKSSLYEESDTCVNLMCHSGSIVSIYHDLRVPFARYVGRYGINHLKRFTIGRVFRERKVYGLHPRELIECAFDIVEQGQGKYLSHTITP